MAAPARPWQVVSARASASGDLRTKEAGVNPSQTPHQAQSAKPTHTKEVAQLVGVTDFIHSISVPKVRGSFDAASTRKTHTQVRAFGDRVAGRWMNLPSHPNCVLRREARNEEHRAVRTHIDEAKEIGLLQRT